MSKSMKGRYFHNIDSKGRLIIPAKLRDCIGREFVITQGIEDCLSVYSLEEWDKLMERLDKNGNSKSSVRYLKMFIRENACDAEIDSQGRTLIPQDMREKVNITKEVVIVGNGEKADIWSKEDYDKLHQKPEFSKEYLRQLLEESDLEI